MNEVASRVILHVDDDPESRRIVDAALSQAGFVVVAASDGLEALQVLQTRVIDLVLTDLRMPRMDGQALIDRLGRIQPGLPIVVVSAPDTVLAVLSALEGRAWGYLSKPVSSIQLVALVKETLAGVELESGIQVVSATERWIELSIPNHTIYITRVREFIESLEIGIDHSERSSLLYAFSELAQNAIEHGNRHNPDTRVVLAWYRFPGLRVFRVRDEGSGFDPLAVTHALGFDAAADPREMMKRRKERGLRPGGLGIASAARFADELLYSERGNEVIMIKRVTETDTKRRADIGPPPL